MSLRQYAMLSILVLLSAGGERVYGATCFCKVTAAPCGDTPSWTSTEIAKSQKGGFTQQLQGRKCQDYCRGIVDSPGYQESVASQIPAKLPDACGTVVIKSWWAIGTQSYRETERTWTYGAEGQCALKCPEWQWLHSDGKACVRGVCSTPGAPNVSIGGGYFTWEGNIYQITGLAQRVCQK
jgi:hypothetical protein